MTLSQHIARALHEAARKGRQLLAGRDRGTVAVTFLLSLPVLLIIIGIFAQLALMQNARVTVDRAAYAAARAAMTSIPTDPTLDGTDGEANVRRAARLILESISPASTNTSDEALAIVDNLTVVGATPPNGFAPRYTYAQDGTTIEITYLTGRANPADTWAQVAAPRVRITVTYPFRLTVPIINNIGANTTISGVQGRFVTYTSQVEVQLSDGREARTDADGNASAGAAINGGN